MSILKCGLRIEAVAVGRRPYEMSERRARIAMIIVALSRASRKHARPESGPNRGSYAASDIGPAQNRSIALRRGRVT